MENNYTYKVVRRGFHEGDKEDFLDEGYNRLILAAEDVSYLLNRGYKIKQSTLFVGNHYALTERQRVA